jgi:hypothetical protein
MSVKNCARDVLVSRNSSLMALADPASTNDCKKMFCVLIDRNVPVFAIRQIFGNTSIQVSRNICT